MTYEEMFVNAITAVFNSLGISIAVWVFFITMIVISVFDCIESRSYRKKLPEKIAREILKAWDVFPDNWNS